MLTKKMLVTFSILVVALFCAAFFINPLTKADCAGATGCQERATGHGTITYDRGIKRQFSFDAIRLPDGRVNGNAIIHNPNFDPRFRGHMEVTCMTVTGNIARIAGVMRNTNDPNLENNTAVFEVTDNGEPGRGDTISGVYFSPPNSPPPTQAYCDSFENFPQNPIDGGNIQVVDCP